MNREQQQPHSHAEAGKAQVSIVIVNWHSVNYLRSCLRSIYEKIRDVDFEIVVIDNASFDGSAEIVRSQFPAARFIQNENNVGYSKANNIAVQQSIGEILLFLNPDTEFIESAIGTLSDYLRNHPEIGAVGCRVVNSDLTIQRHYLQAYPTLLNQILDFDLLKRTFPRWKLWGMRALYDYEGEPLDVEAIAGSCLMVKRSAFERIGGFTESYFMYGEDLDLSYKMRLAGFGIQYIGEGRLIHHYGKSSELHSRRNFAEVMTRESTAMFLKASRSDLYARVFRYMTGCAALLRLCVILLLACFGGIIFFRKWVIASSNKWARVLYWSAYPKVWTGPGSNASG